MQLRNIFAFGELVPVAHPVEVSGFLVARGAIGTIEIGAETKILAKAMIKQIDRVIGDLVRQVDEFKRGGGTPITVGLVGVNFSESYTSYEGERPFPTDGRKYKHPNPGSSRSRKPPARKGPTSLR